MHVNRIASICWPLRLLLYEYLIPLGMYTRTRKSWVLALLFGRLPAGDVGCSAAVAMVGRLQEHCGGHSDTG
eukprot:7912533-Pyramimonas_sp.AAC.1